MRAVATPHCLVVIRHSKTEAYADSDFARELTPRGRSDAEATGVWLASVGVEPDVALVSAATRARQTFEVLAEAAQWSLEATLDESLYGADEDAVLDLVAQTDESVGTLVVIGHNPTIGIVAQLLDNGEASAEATDQLAFGYPTSTASVFDLPGSWAKLAFGSARLRDVHVGRG